MSKVYAARSDVPVDRSQTEIRKILTELGADRFAFYSQPSGDQIVFEIRDCYYRIAGPPLATEPKTKAQSEQAARSAWRALVLLVKAKKVAIDQGYTTVEREFMADTVMPDGTTLIEHREALVDFNYKQGGLPRLGFTSGADQS